MILRWIQKDNWREANLLNPDDTIGVRFSLMKYPSCHRRGPWRLLIEVASGNFHHCCGCFDEQDQPMRLYHNESCALQEAESLAAVLTAGFEPTKER